jgi:hypothetical protein
MSNRSRRSPPGLGLALGLGLGLGLWLAPVFIGPGVAGWIVSVVVVAIVVPLVPLASFSIWSTEDSWFRYIILICWLGTLI